MIRLAVPADLPAIVEIYNATIPSRQVTADTEPITVASREAWLAEHQPDRHPLWVWCDAQEQVGGWVSVQAFYGRPAYAATVELSLYIAPTHQRQGIGTQLLEHGLAAWPQLGIQTLLGFVFAHNEPSLRLLERFQFQEWGYLPRVAQLDGCDRDLIILGRRLMS